MFPKLFSELIYNTSAFFFFFKNTCWNYLIVFCQILWIFLRSVDDENPAIALWQRKVTTRDIYMLIAAVDCSKCFTLSYSSRCLVCLTWEEQKGGVELFETVFVFCFFFQSLQKSAFTDLWLHPSGPGKNKPPCVCKHWFDPVSAQPTDFMEKTASIWMDFPVNLETSSMCFLWFLLFKMTVFTWRKQFPGWFFQNPYKCWHKLDNCSFLYFTK